MSALLCQTVFAEEADTSGNQASSVFYSARYSFDQREYKKAAAFFEYVISNGKDFNTADYSEAVQKLFICYNSLGEWKKTENLYLKFKETDFEAPVYSSMTQFYTTACCRLGIEEYKAKNFSKAKDYFSRMQNEEGQENFSSDLALLRGIYSAKMLLDEGKPVKDAEATLQSVEKYVKKSRIEKSSDSYYSVLLQCKIQGESWEEIPSVYAKIKSPDADALFVISSYYYRKGQFEKVDSSCGELYASALCRLGKYEEACREFEKLNIKTADYSSALFILQRYDQAYEVAAGADDFQKDYLMGLCKINTKGWKKAAEHFASYIRLYSTKQDFQKLSLYYKGYAEYNLAEFKNAYASFVRYTIETQDDINEYTLKSYEYAVKAALQNADFKNALVQAGNLVKFSQNEESRRRAVVLNAEIFADYGKYDEAIQLLSPYTSGRDEFAAQALFITARMYERRGDASTADETYRKIYETMPRSSYAQEAMYRAGEVYYSAGKYAEAFSRFNAYIYKYASGDFSDPAFYYCGDCALRLGELDRSVMLNRTLLQKYPSSVYAYGAYKNLLSAYYSQENYSEALNAARTMLKNYPQQAADDEIGKKVSELEKIVSGTDRRVAEKQTEYSKLGGAKTKAGRAAGTQLVRLYSESLYTQNDAYTLASELLPNQTADEERADAAYNAEVIADFCRKNQDNKKAAEMYLLAAEYYRNVKNGNRAAAALYGAAEAFAAEGLSGDARETASLLKQLYPKSVQAEKVDRVTGAERN